MVVKSKNYICGLKNRIRMSIFSKKYTPRWIVLIIDVFISTASIVTRLTTDVTNVQQAFQMIIRIFARAPSMLVFALIAAFRVNHELSLIFLISMPILFFGMLIMSTRVRPIFERVFKTYDKMKAAGVDAHLHVAQKMGHVYPLWPSHEGRKARREIAEIIKTNSKN